MVAVAVSAAPARSAVLSCPPVRLLPNTLQLCSRQSLKAAQARALHTTSPHSTRAMHAHQRQQWHQEQLHCRAPQGVARHMTRTAVG